MDGKLRLRVVRPEEAVPYYMKDMAEEEAASRGYPVINGVQVVPLKTYVHAADRGNYGLVVVVEPADFKMKEESSRDASGKDAQLVRQEDSSDKRVAKNGTPVNRQHSVSNIVAGRMFEKELYSHNSQRNKIGFFVTVTVLLYTGSSSVDMPSFLRVTRHGVAIEKLPVTRAEVDPARKGYKLISINNLGIHIINGDPLADPATANTLRNNGTLNKEVTDSEETKLLIHILKTLGENNDITTSMTIQLKPFVLVSRERLKISIVIFNTGLIDNDKAIGNIIFSNIVFGIQFETAFNLNIGINLDTLFHSLRSKPGSHGRFTGSRSTKINIKHRITSFSKKKQKTYIQEQQDPKQHIQKRTCAGRVGAGAALYQLTERSRLKRPTPRPTSGRAQNARRIGVSMIVPATVETQPTAAAKRSPTAVMKLARVGVFIDQHLQVN